MENYLLILKNIYRLLRANDYPVFSDSVIPASENKGLTLISFWKQILLSRWKNTFHGKMIWRTDGSKNRYLSEICNRKLTFSFYQVYSDEIVRELTPGEIIQQAEVFALFLQEHHYRQDVLRKRLTIFLSFCEEHDSAFKAAAEDFKNVSDILPDNLMSWSWFLAMLTLHALAGEFMNSPELCKLRKDSDFLQTEFIESNNKLLFTNSIPAGTLHILTGKNCEVWQFSLNPIHFYGKEKELFDLADAVLQKSKLLLSGIGGSGKTELLRQLLQRLISGNANLNIATIQYENSLVESFARHFKNLHGSNAQERFNEAIGMLSSDNSRPVLLLIDNMNNPAEDPDVLSRIRALPCAVFISSRLSELPGFTTFHVSEPDKNSASLIFRNNVKKVLTDSEKILLQDFLSESQLRHPLTLMLMGRSAGSSHLKLQDIFDSFRLPWFQIQGKHADSASVEHHFRNIYKKLYSISGLSQDELEFLRVFSILPYSHYSFEDILSCTFAQNRNIPDMLAESLSLRGWLEKSGNTYSMHPVIAESIRKKQPFEKDFPYLWHALALKLNFNFNDLGNNDRTQSDTAFLILYVLNRISAPVSIELARLAGQAGIILCLSKYADLNLTLLTEKIMNKCSSGQEELSCYIELIYLFSDIPHMEKCMQLEEHQAVEHSIPENLYNVFHAMTAAGYGTMGNLDRVKSIYEEMSSSGIPEHIRFSLIATLASCLQAFLFREEARDLLDKEIPTFDINTETGKNAYIILSLQAGSNAAWMGNTDEAKEFIRKIDAVQGSESDTVHYLMPKLNLMADIASLENDLETSIACYSKSLHLIKTFSGKFNQNYFIQAAKLALLYSKTDEQLEKAYELYDETLKIGEMLFPDDSNMQVVLNNYASALLEGGRADDALPLLLRAYKAGENMAPISKAEPAWNLSRVWRQKKDCVRELQYIQEALPVFIQTYGDEHIKTVNARNRLKELNGK